MSAFPSGITQEVPSKIQWFWLSSVMGILVLAPGAWAANNCKTLHVFDGTGQGNPAAGLIFDTTGNLYGTTVIGGAHR
jgi:hypothetical protein